MPGSNYPAVIYNSSSKILSGLLPPLLLTLLTVIFYTHINFTSAAAAFAMDAVAVLIWLYCVYRFILGLIYLITIHRNYLMVTVQGLTEVSFFYPAVSIKWRDVKEVGTYNDFRCWFFTASGKINPFRTNHYSILLPMDGTVYPYSWQLTAGYLAVSLPDLAMLLGRFILPKKDY